MKFSSTIENRQFISKNSSIVENNISECHPLGERKLKSFPIMGDISFRSLDTKHINALCVTLHARGREGFIVEVTVFLQTRA